MIDITRTPIPADQAILERLLTKLATWAGGAIDTWPLVRLQRMVPDTHAFLLKNCEIMRSLAVVIRALLAENGREQEPAVRRALDGMCEGCEKVGASLFVLDQFQTTSLPELHSAMTALEEGHGAILASIRELANALGLQISYLQGWTPERENYFGEMVANLRKHFRQTDVREEAPA